MVGSLVVFGSGLAAQAASSTLGLKQEVLLAEELSRASGKSRGALMQRSALALRAARQQSDANDQGPRRHEAQYLDALMLAKFSSIYDLLYDTEKKKAFESEVVGIKLSTLFDGFLEMIESGDVSDSMKSAANQVGKCLAKKMIAVRSSCELNEDTKESPSTVRLAWLRTTCGALMSDCKVRRAFFAAAKPTLEEARNDPAVQKQIRDTFEKVFPERFRQGVLRQLSQVRGNYTNWVAEKFLPATPFKLFGDVSAPSLVASGIEPMFIADQEVPGMGFVQRLDGMAFGLRADLAIARMGQQLLASRSNFLRTAVASETGAALWSAVQQLLVLTGGTRAVFMDAGKGFSLVEGDIKKLPPRFSKESPYLKGELFGGWSISRAAKDDVALRFAPWDWENYINLPSESGSPISLLPHLFRLDSAGRPSAVGPESAMHTLDDQVALADAVSEFLELTEQGGAFSAHLGPEESLIDLMDGKKPILLPSQARLLGYAIVAGIARNLTHPDYALIEKQGTIEPGQGLGVKFFESASLENKDRPNAKTTSLARLILVAAKFRSRIANDPQFPGTNRKEMLDLIDTLVPIGALTLGAQAQNPDGSFRSVLNASEQVADLEATTLALRAIQTAHLASGMKVLTLNLKAGMNYLKTHMPSPGVVTQLRPEARVAMWHFLLLWDQAKPEWSDAIFGDIGKQLRQEWERKLLDTLN